MDAIQLLPVFVLGAAFLLAGLGLALWDGWSRSSGQDSEPVAQEAEGARKLAIYNPVTGLLAQWYLELRLDEEIARARRYGLSLVVLTLEGTPQRESEETSLFGFGESDVTKAVRGCVRNTDLIATVGFTQFAICLLHCDRAGAIPVIRRLMDELGEGDWRIGLAAYPDDDYAGRDLIDVANSRLAPWRASRQDSNLAA